MSKYSLLKYSRSYPPDDPGHVAFNPTSSDAVWQHFAFPELYLSFGRNDKGELQTAMLKILWTKDIVLEEMDLLSFKSRSSSSSFVPSQASQGQSTNSSLRVVYRDSVVGFRYTKFLNKTFTNQATKYRRFQISFTDPSAATQFVNMIAPLCLCKLSSNPPHVIPQMRLSSAQNISYSQCTQSQSQSLSQAMNSSDSFHQRMSIATSRGNTANKSDDILQYGSSQTTEQPTTLGVEPSTSLPASSPIPSRSEKIIDRPTSENDHLASIDMEHLTNTQPDQLEKVIANLLREPHFVSLLEKIDSLWRVKGLIDGNLGTQSGSL